MQNNDCKLEAWLCSCIRVGWCAQVEVIMLVAVSVRESHHSLLQLAAVSGGDIQYM